MDCRLLYRTIRLLYRSLCDAEVPCTCFTLRYNDKHDSPDNEYNVRGTDEYTKYLVKNFGDINLQDVIYRLTVILQVLRKPSGVQRKKY